MSGNLGNATEAVLKELTEVEGAIVSFIIPDIVRYELISGANPEKRKKVHEKLEKFKSLSVSKDVLLLAALFDKMYETPMVERTDKKPAGMRHGVGDNILAATIFKESTLFLTANDRDFPGPFFKNIRWYEIKYHKEKRPACTYYTLLAPEREIIKRALDFMETEEKRLKDSPTRLDDH